MSLLWEERYTIGDDIKQHQKPTKGRLLTYSEELINPVYITYIYCLESDHVSAPHVIAGIRQELYI